MSGAWTGAGLGLVRSMATASLSRAYLVAVLLCGLTAGRGISLISDERAGVASRTRNMAKNPKNNDSVERLVELMSARSDEDECESNLLAQVVFQQFALRASDVCGDGHESKVRFLMDECHMDEKEVISYINGRAVLAITC